MHNLWRVSIGLIVLVLFYLVCVGLALLNWNGADVAYTVQFFAGALVVVFVLGAAGYGIVAAVMGLLFSRRSARPSSKEVLILPIAALISGLAVWYLPVFMRTAALHNAASRLDPLVRGIETFTAQRGHPPATLDELVPEYVDHIPRRALGSCYPLRYTDGAIINECPNGFLTLDQFTYEPGSPCPATRNYRRFKKWCYFYD